MMLMTLAYKKLAHYGRTVRNEPFSSSFIVSSQMDDSDAE